MGQIQGNERGNSRTRHGNEKKSSSGFAGGNGRRAQGTVQGGFEATFQQKQEQKLGQKWQERFTAKLDNGTSQRKAREVHREVSIISRLKEKQLGI